MTDRELVEYAAKAAGYDRLGMWDESLKCLWDGEEWSFDPLGDDGDAFQLAVKLRIAPTFNEDRVFTGYETVNSGRRPYHNPITEKFGDDPQAATRRAIVRRAAEIARAQAQ